MSLANMPVLIKFHDVYSESYCYDTEVGTNYLGHDLNGCQNRVDSASLCRKLCQDKLDCVGWTWANKDHPKWPLSCCVKSKMARKVEQNNVIAGLRKTFK